VSTPRSTRPILIASLPRSGSSWVGEILARAPGVRYSREPDNEKTRAAAYVLKQGMHRFPHLGADDVAPSYELLWQLAFAGRIPAAERLLKGRVPLLRGDAMTSEYQVGIKCGLVHLSGLRHTCGADAAKLATSAAESGVDVPTLEENLRTLLALEDAARASESDDGDELRALDEQAPIGNAARQLVKSVHCPLALPWIERRFGPRTVVLLRSPFGLISSMLRLRLPDALRNIPGAPELGLPAEPRLPPESSPDRAMARQLAGQVAAVYRFLELEVARHPDWIVIRHETLCSSPVEEFRRLFGALDLEWTADAEGAVLESDRGGSGFDTHRVAAAEPEKWKTELSPEQIAEIRSVLSAYGLDEGG
jgi:hypothetical protein